MAPTDQPGPDQTVGEMPFLEHLLELRDRLLRMVLAVLGGVIVLLPFANSLYSYLAEPLLRHMPAGATMIATEVASPFLAPFKLALVAAVFLAMPVILYLAWAFIAPGLYQKERRFALPPHADIDADRISQVVTNLVGNAIRATPAGGSVAVACTGADAWVVLEVADTGEGLAPADLDRVFERFYRVPGRAGAGQDSGTGIGLTISREIIRGHGGDLVAASAGPGAGAVFTARLPRIAGASGPAVPATA